MLKSHLIRFFNIFRFKDIPLFIYIFKSAKEIEDAKNNYTLLQKLDTELNTQIYNKCDMKTLTFYINLVLKIRIRSES